MSSFLIFSLGLIAVVLVVILWPLLRARETVQSAQAQTEMALQVLREQRRELDAERAAGRIDDAAYATSVAELERRLLAESGAPEAVLAPRAPRRVLAGVVAVLVPVLAGGLYLKLGNPSALDPANTQAPQSVTPAQIESMVTTLAAKVKANPDDTEGMQMLGRSYMVLERFKEAAATYALLATKLPKDASVYADWADALASAAGNRLEGEPEKLIAKALQLDAKNIKALALAGTVAYDRQDFKGAVNYWEQLAALVDPQSEMGQSAQEMLKDARAHAGLPQAATGKMPTPATAPAAAPGKPVLRVTGRLSLAPALKDKVSPQDVVFIFARSPAGGPPLAALRISVADLPMDFDFAKAQAMMGAAPEGKIVVAARVSKSGNAKASPGDLEGRSAEIAPDAQGIKLVIDSEVK